MKKNKLIGIGALCAMMGLSGCGLIGGQTCVHDWSPWDVVEPSTCIDRGYRERYCMKCEKYQSRSLPIDAVEGHNWAADKSLDRDPTCTAKGVTGSQYCTLCGQKRKGNETEYSGHIMERVANPTDPKYKDATCEEAGLYQKKCINCDATEDVPIDPKGHLESAPVYQNEGDLLGTVSCAREGCGKFIAYQLDIEKATGYHSPKIRMNAYSGEEANKATWNIAPYIDTVIPSGSYDIKIEAAMTDAAHGVRKMYNMAREDIWVDGDKEGNNSQGIPDKVTESPYRYFLNVDGNVYYPTTKESFSDLGLEVGASNTKFVRFIEGVNINKDSSNFSLVHGDIGYSLYIKSIRLVPHEHQMHTETFDSTNGRVGYTLEKCINCGYRKITIDANDANKVVTGSMVEADEGRLVKLGANGNSVNYKIYVDECITGDLYLVGRQSASAMDKSPYEMTVTNTNEDVTGDWSGKKSSDFFEVSGNPSLEGYSEEGKLLIGKVTLKENARFGGNELVITRTGDNNISMSKLVIEARVGEHIHKFEHKAEFDEDATCKKDKREYLACSCGQYKYETIPNTKSEHTWGEPVVIAATCNAEGFEIYTCTKCGERKQTTIPRTHSMVTITPPESANYGLTECEICHEAREATWSLAQSSIEDYKDGAYVASTAEIKSGKTSSGADFSVMKFDAAKRRVTLTYIYGGAEAVTAKLSMFATTKASNIASCQPYVQTTGQPSDPQPKFVISVNGAEVTIPEANKNKNIGDLGLKNVPSQLEDNGALADPMWLEYCEFQLTPNATNTIVIECPTKTQYSMYIGGFRLSH